jgi:16S rRNA (guanine966-N2)-methyltransferase
VRIVAGSRKGARIFAPKGRDTRPTSDRVREAVFGILGPIEGLTVLDLFAGSGALGLEALSRGAVSATFVESDPAALESIERNLSKLELEGARIVRSDAMKHLARTPERYDVVFLDPPYEMVESLRMPLAEHLPRVLAEGGLVVFETAADVQPELPLAVHSTRRHGSTQLTVFEAP